MAKLFKIQKSLYRQASGNLELNKPKPSSKITKEEFAGLGQRYGITPPNMQEETVDQKIQRRIKEVARQIRGLPPI